MGVVLGIVVVVVGLILYMQIAMIRRARAMQGKEVSSLPGQTGSRIGKLDHALVYFFSPQCGACRAITPRVRELAKGNRSVFAVDVMDDMPLARALGVMATPSTVEIEKGKIVGYHIGPIPGPVMQRFART
jgi:thioredoxin 1